MKIIIKEIPLSKNEYIKRHWTERMEYKDMIAWLIYERISWIGELNTYKKSKIIFDIYFKYRRRRDIQNYLGGGLIAWLDALVDNSIIFDDNYDCIGQPIVNFHIDKVNPRTEIMIERG